MNKQNVSYIVCFIGGALVGAGLAEIFISKKHERKAAAKIREMSDYYIQRTKLYEDLLKTDQTDDIPHQTPDDGHTPNPSDDIPKRDDSSILDNMKNREYVDYTKYDTSPINERIDISVQYEHPEDDKDSDQEIYEKSLEVNEELQAMKKKKPKIIKASEFGEGSSEGIKYERTFDYYKDDGTLVDDRDNVLSSSDTFFLFGDALMKFGFETNDEHSIYIRNYNTATDYEIIKIFDAYAEID